jgi:two-component system sensor histidine kinase/response regulator
VERVTPLDHALGSSVPPRPTPRPGKGPAVVAEGEVPATILVVDDRASNLEALESLLAPLGERVVRAAGGEEALRLCLQNEYAAVLLDLRMPKMDGIECASYLRQRERSRHVPILFLTAAEVDKREVHRAYSLGAVDFITKPFDAEILRSKVRVFIEIHRNRERERRLARELQTKARELERSNADLAQFAHVAAHDLKEPLRTMRSYVELIVERLVGEGDPKLAKWSGHLIEAADRMRNLIEDLLDYARFDRKGVAPAWVETAAVLDEALLEVHASIEESGAKVTHGWMPSVFGDRAQLVRLFENLVSNAVKFHGASAPEIHVGVERRGTDWLFRVEDNGIGIPEKDLSRVFGLFERLHARDKYPGTGLGLAICRKIVERHGGRIWVESEAGVGSTFLFTLPAGDASVLPPA